MKLILSIPTFGHGDINVYQQKPNKYLVQFNAMKFQLRNEDEAICFASNISHKLILKKFNYIHVVKEYQDILGKRTLFCVKIYKKIFGKTGNSIDLKLRTVYPLLKGTKYEAQLANY